MSIPSYAQIIGGQERQTDQRTPIHSKFTGQVIAYVNESSDADVADAVAIAERAHKEQALTPTQRYQILTRAATLTREREAELRSLMARETGITIKDAQSEVDRAIQTFLQSGEEAKRIAGHCVPMQGQPGFEKKMAFTIRVPVGVVCGITPFNSPYNGVVHKAAPAIAAGNGVVLKPSPAAVLSALAAARVLLDAGLPPGLISVVLGGPSVVEALLADKRIGFYSFTGSPAVGQIVKEKTGLRRVTLELGNNSATIVCNDADLKKAVPMIARAGFRKAGQVCTSVQRVYVQREIEARFLEELAAETGKLVVGNPEDPATDVGVMVSEAKAAQAESWIKEAAAAGARVVVGGRREGALLYPTVLGHARQDMKVVCEEIFAPVISVVPFDTVQQAIDWVNDSPYGLTAGIFTSDLNTAFQAAREIRVGTLNINDTSSARADLMPYGGVKDSGMGLEGPRYAIEEMTESRLVTLNL